METILESPPQTIAPWVDGKAMKAAQSFIVQLKKRDNRFIDLRVKTVAVESIALSETGSSHIQKNEITIRAQLQEPCEHAKAEQSFKELIEDMELAGYSSRFVADELYRSDVDTAFYILSFVKKQLAEL